MALVYFTRRRWVFAIALSLALSVGAVACRPPAREPSANAPKTKNNLPGNLYRLNYPTDLAFAPDGTLFFTEQTGAVRVVKNGKLAPKPVATFNVPKMQGYHETGLLGLALGPRFSSEGKIYVYHTYRAGENLYNRIVRFDRRKPGNREVIFDKIVGERIHNGGKLLFGHDGFLYVGVGEANRRHLSRETSIANGKVLRLTADGKIPGDNPFVGSPVLAYGLRNIFGMTFDSNENLYITENGPEKDDEINLITPGGDYGWPIETGRGSGHFERPLLVLREPVAPTGIVYYDRSRLRKIRKKLVFGDWNSGQLHAVDPRAKQPRDRIIASLDEGITALAIAPDGALYVATATSIRRLDRL